MNPDFSWPKGFDLGIEFGYLNPAVVAPKRHNPRVILKADAYASNSATVSHSSPSPS